MNLAHERLEESQVFINGWRGNYGIRAEDAIVVNLPMLIRLNLHTKLEEMTFHPPVPVWEEWEHTEKLSYPSFFPANGPTEQPARL